MWSLDTAVYTCGHDQFLFVPSLLDSLRVFSAEGESHIWKGKNQGFFVTFLYPVDVGRTITCYS